MGASFYGTLRAFIRLPRSAGPGKIFFTLSRHREGLKKRIPLKKIPTKAVAAPLRNQFLAIAYFFVCQLSCRCCRKFPYQTLAEKKYFSTGNYIVSKSAAFVDAEDEAPSEFSLSSPSSRSSFAPSQHAREKGNADDSFKTGPPINSALSPSFPREI